MHHQSVFQVNFPTPGLIELLVERGDVVFTPGDCVALFNPAGVSRPYSISSGKDDPYLRFLIRDMQGEVTEWIAKLSEGDVVKFSPPFGWFRPGLNGDAQVRSVFVATGTGISPFISYLRTQPEARPEMCLYGVRTAADAVDVAFLESRCPTTLCVTRESVNGYVQGRVTEQLDRLPIDDDVHYYLCGLDAMIDDVSTWLESKGVHFSRIHREVFFNA
jgi:ferredoxin-NADP reductase